VRTISAGLARRSREKSASPSPGWTHGCGSGCVPRYRSWVEGALAGNKAQSDGDVQRVAGGFLRGVRLGRGLRRKQEGTWVGLKLKNSIFIQGRKLRQKVEKIQVTIRNTGVFRKVPGSYPAGLFRGRRAFRLLLERGS